MRIVYNSYQGRFSDNPRAIWERLAGRPGIDHVWLADPDHLGAFPEEARTVSINDPAAREVLESADLLVANSHTELEWDKRPGTTYLQTWHGTPLKRIHRDVLWAPEGRLDRLDRDVAKWDLLLSPNADSTPRLAKAFSFDRPIFESGYPRNDALVSPGAEQRRAQARAALGLRPGQRAVLYAPTWRDQETFIGEGRIEAPLALDQLRAGLED